MFYKCRLYTYVAVAMSIDYKERVVNVFQNVITKAKISVEVLFKEKFYLK